MPGDKVGSFGSYKLLRLSEERYQNNFHVMLVLIRFFCVAKVFEYYHIIELLVIFKGLNEASRSQILRLEKINNNLS